MVPIWRYFSSSHGWHACGLFQSACSEVRECLPSPSGATGPSGSRFGCPVGGNYCLYSIRLLRLRLSNREIEEKLLKHSHNFDKAAALRAAFGGTIPEGSVSLPANEQWKAHRRMMAPCMSPAYLSTKTNRILQSTQKLVALWSLKSNLAQSSGGVFECDDDIERFAMVRRYLSAMQGYGSDRFDRTTSLIYCLERILMHSNHRTNTCFRPRHWDPMELLDPY